MRLKKPKKTKELPKPRSKLSKILKIELHSMLTPKQIYHKTLIKTSNASSQTASKQEGWSCSDLFSQETPAFPSRKLRRSNLTPSTPTTEDPNIGVFQRMESRGRS